MAETHVRNPDAPFSAYDYKQEKEPYLFVSYAHADRDKVFPYIKRLHDDGFRIWYDEGIPYSQSWTGVIATALKRAQMMLLFVSQASVDSINVTDEFRYARNQRKPYMPLYLEKPTLTDEWEFLLSNAQAAYDIHASYRKVTQDLDQSTRRPVEQKKAVPAPAPTPILTPPPLTLEAGKLYPKPFGGRQWLVLDVDKQNNRVLLLSEDIIEKKAYNEEWTDVTWENCTLRKYLNGEFYESFGKEKDRIALTHNENPANTWGTWRGKRFNTPGGNPTDDRIFLLSVPEILKYYPGLKLYKDSDGNEYGYEPDKRLAAKLNEEAGWWWLRSPGFDQGGAAFVYNDGYVSLSGDDVLIEAGGVRPALWLNL